ncbi:MAG: RNA polymerase sigma factor [Blastocatellia bacterium]
MLQREQKCAVPSSGGKRLLEWLDSDAQRAAERYRRIRAKLIRMFSAERLPFPEDLADETITRVGRAIDEGKPISVKPETFFYSVASNVRFEEHRRLSKHAPIEDASVRDTRTRLDSESESSMEEVYLACLNGCLEGLSPEQRMTIVEYYKGLAPGEDKRNRKQLAKLLGISPKALNSRAVRLRTRLEACVKDCVSSTQGGEEDLESIEGS